MLQERNLFESGYGENIIEKKIDNFIVRDRRDVVTWRNARYLALRLWLYDVISDCASWFVASNTHHIEDEIVSLDFFIYLDAFRFICKNLNDAINAISFNQSYTH